MSQNPKGLWVGTTPQERGFPNITHLARIEQDVLKMQEAQMSAVQQIHSTVPAPERCHLQQHLSDSSASVCFWRSSWQHDFTALITASIWLYYVSMNIIKSWTFSVKISEKVIRICIILCLPKITQNICKSMCTQIIYSLYFWL